MVSNVSAQDPTARCCQRAEARRTVCKHWNSDSTLLVRAVVNLFIFTSHLAINHGLQTRHSPNKAARYIPTSPLLTLLQTHRSTGKRIPKLPKETSIYIQGSTSDLYHRVAAESRFDIHRLRITKEDGTLVPNDKKTTVNSLDLKDGSVIQVKDLGP